MGILKWIKKIKENLYIDNRTGKDFLESPVIDVVNIEFTTRCNLKCVYCAASQPGYMGMDLDPAALAAVIESLKEGNVRIVNVNGHGETTIYKDWYRYCNKILDMGLRLHITSNFAREFSHEEIKTLSRFENITASCDTGDPVLHQKLRRGANLETLALNIVRIRETALRQNRQPPLFSFNCVLTDRNVPGLPDYIEFAGKLGVRYINFCSMKKYPDLEGTLNPVHVSEMPIDRLPGVRTILDESILSLKRSGISCKMQLGILDSLERKIENPGKSETAAPGEADSQAEHEETEQTAAEPLIKNGEPELTAGPVEIRTRDCLDPWSFIMVRANNEIHPCCWYLSLHSSGSHRSLFEVFNNTKSRELRRRLLTGDLPPDCINCSGRGWTSTEILKKKVWNYIHPGLTNRLIAAFKRIPDIKADILVPHEIIYGDGWYNPEENPGIEDPEWQRWRWTSKTARCLAKNPQKEALLIIGGSVDIAKHNDQKVIININGHILDTFAPVADRFLKEYRIKKELLGKRGKTRISIKTNKTFVPAETNPLSTDRRELGIRVYRLFFGERRKV